MSTQKLRDGSARRSERGYTAVEVLMSMSVLAVGVIGVFSMEKITLASNVHAKNLAIATHIGQSWLGVLEAEASLWDATPDSISRTNWLSASPMPPAWFRPAPVAAVNFGPEFDELGNPVGGNGQFCVDLRVSPFNGLQEELAGQGLRRVEVRVFWIRDHATATSSTTPMAFPCQWAPAQVSAVAQASMLHFVYLSGAVRQVVP
jgi:hypothetical protein